jgi:hypothetical protein
MFFGMAMASGETIARRWWMMASGQCSPREYERMTTEKVTAALAMGAAMLSATPQPAALLRPWYLGARRNARRLRAKK